MSRAKTLSSQLNPFDLLPHRSDHHNRHHHHHEDPDNNGDDDSNDDESYGVLEFVLVTVLIMFNRDTEIEYEYLFSCPSSSMPTFVTD